MTIKTNLLSLLFIMVFYTVNAQDTLNLQLTTDKDMKSEKSIFPPKPKNAWELGVHGGHMFIDGDVDTRIPGGYGVGLHLRKAIHYAFSVRADFMYGQAKGLDPQMWSHVSKGGGLVEEVFTPYANQDGWFPAYKTSYGYIALQGVLNIGNILFHKENNKWNWYTALGVGLSNHDTKLNLLDANDQPYSGLGSVQEDFDTQTGRKDIKKKLDAIYDNTYETDSWQKKGIFRVGDKTNIHVAFTASMGVSRKLSKRINLGLEHQVMLSDNDMMDGIRFRTAYDQTNNNDIVHYTNLRLGINLGNFDKVTEPLYWLNPLNYQMKDIAELKQRPVFDLTDTDGDGVIDMLDQEPDTPMGARVDPRGIAIDSDGDGIPDYKDKEPFSPPGHSVNEFGVADVKCCITMEDVNKAIDMKSASFSKTDCGKWFLPMVHFDPDRTNVKPEYFGHLHHVATVMKMCPDLCISVIGYSDINNKNKNKNALSYARAENVVDYLVSKYGFDRSRFKVGYGNDVNPTFKNNKGEGYMNRRVEIKVCGPTDADAQMTKPEGADKFKDTGAPRGGSGSGKGSQFKGDKNSGF